MKNIRTPSLCLTALLLSLAGVARAGAQVKPPTRKFKHNSKVETIYDKTKNQTTAYLRPMTIASARGTLEAQIWNEGKRTETIPSERVWLTAYFVSPGKILTKPESVVIGFRSWTMDKTKYDNDRSLVINLDGTSTKLGQMELLERRVDSNMQLSDHRYYLESLEKPLPYETFLQLTNAATVKLTVGGTEFLLANENLEAFRDLLSRIQ